MADQQTNVTGVNINNTDPYPRIYLGLTAGGTGFGGMINIAIEKDDYAVNPDYYIIPGMPGAQPQQSAMLEMPNGKLFGTTQSGGATNLGVLYEFDPASGTISKKFDFYLPFGSNPRGGLILGSNGKYYGVTSNGGVNANGAIYEYDFATNTATNVFNFLSATTGGNPSFGKLFEFNFGSGLCYGLTGSGGANGNGVLYSFDINTKVYTKIMDFTLATTGSVGFPCVFVKLNNKLYGTTQSGGANNAGILFEFDPSTNTFTKKFDFTGNTGARIGSAAIGGLLVIGSKLYGATQAGGATGVGAVFEYDPVTDIYTATSLAAATGSNPRSRVAQLSPTKLLCLASLGGANSQGAIFEYDFVLKTVTLRASFAAATLGNAPLGELIRSGVNGKWYTTASAGGSGSGGTLLEYDSNTFTLTKKIDFNLQTFGASVIGTMSRFDDTRIYGLLQRNSTNSLGSIFEYNIDTKVLTTKYSFAAGTDGNTPIGGLTLANGKLYGTTTIGGANNFGVLFEYDVNTSTYTKKFDFTGLVGVASGSQPTGPLFLASNGKLYGTCPFAGANNAGTIFEYVPSTNTFTKKYDFVLNNNFNIQPKSGIIEISGTLYFASVGNDNTGAPGTISSYVIATNTHTVLYNFVPATGRTPYGRIVLGDDGKIYGTTASGGANALGVLWSYDIGGNVYTKLFDFTSISGNTIKTELFKGPHGKFYTIAQLGGAYGIGTVISYDSTNNTLTKLFDLRPDRGGTPLTAMFTQVL